MKSTVTDEIIKYINQNFALGSVEIVKISEKVVMIRDCHNDQLFFGMNKEGDIIDPVSGIVMARKMNDDKWMNVPVNWSIIDKKEGDIDGRNTPIS